MHPSWVARKAPYVCRAMFLSGHPCFHVSEQLKQRQLFDLQQDPSEKNNLAALPEQQMRVKGMASLLAAQQQAFDDPLLQEKQKKN
jgi:hypothetical protein